MRVQGRIVALLLVVAIVGLSCGSAARSLQATGVSLKVVGEQFVAISEQVTTGCQAKAIPAPLCERYRHFGEHFKRAFPLAVGMWEIARKVDDAKTQQRAEEVIALLSKDLERFISDVLTVLGMSERGGQ